MILETIDAAFKERGLPKELYTSRGLSDCELKELENFSIYDWRDMNGEQLENNYEALYWLSPQAFCFYLPGIMSASVRENEPNLICVHSIINMLDRSPDESTWDDFFISRWTILNTKECDAVIEWIVWLTSFEDSPFSESALSRSFDTMVLLRSRSNHMS